MNDSRKRFDHSGLAIEKQKIKQRKASLPSPRPTSDTSSAQNLVTEREEKVESLQKEIKYKIALGLKDKLHGAAHKQPKVDKLAFTFKDQLQGRLSKLVTQK